MNRDQKAAVVEEIAGQLQESEAIFAVDYRGITVDQIAELRTKLRGADARFRVVKNSLSERAADQAGLDTLKPMLVGPTALAFVKGDAALAAKALNDTARQLNNVIDFKGGVLNGTVLTADDVRSIARLPAREVLYAQLVGTVAAPLTGLARGLNALIGGLAIQLQAIADQGLVTGEAPAPAAAAPAAEAEAPTAEAEAPAAEAEAPVEEAPAAEAEAPAAEPEAPAEEAPAEEAEAEPEAPATDPEPEASDTTETEAASDAATPDD
ncbi:MAG TPA: 50S ribosomal protein L10 [Solirubrobacteraceae bacterium]|nr:50S ribosomal protein L10 [Solirubrobacteraceae bacterium]